MRKVTGQIHLGRLSGPFSVTSRLIAAVAGSSTVVTKLASHPVGASLCLALGYILICSAYFVITGRQVAIASWSLEQMQRLELIKGLLFVFFSSLIYFGFAFYLLKRIAAQRQHLGLLFNTVSDPIFLVEVEPNDRYRFLNVNASFLRTTGLTRKRVIGRHIEEVFPETFRNETRRNYQIVVQQRKSMTWEESISCPTGKRVGEVTLTPLVDKAGTVVQLTGVIHDMTERKAAEESASDCYRRLQLMSRRLVNAQETERRHIARELHDEIGQNLTVAQLNLQAIAQSTNASSLQQQLRASAEAVEQVLEQVRDISLNLRPSMLDDLGLESALRWYLSRQAALAGWETELHVEGLDQRLDPMIETECFRIAQEALTNIIRHAEARRVGIEIAVRNDRLHLSVQDDGKGFHVTSSREDAVLGSSLGLLSMEERAALAGGELEFLSAPGKGTTVRAWFPLKWRTPETDLIINEIICETNSCSVG